MKYFFQNIKNNIDFFLRQKFSFSKLNYFAKNEEKEGLFSSIGCFERERTLYDKFDLAYLKSNSTRANYLENLYMLDVLDTFLNIDFSNNLKVLDIGCKNWF